VEETAEVVTPSRRGRSSRKIKEEDEVDSPDVEEGTDAEVTVAAPAEEEGDEDESVPEAGPSRRGARGRGRGRARGRGRGARRGGTDAEADEETHTDAEENNAEGAEEHVGTPRRRARKSVSYREIAPADDGEEDAEGEDDVELEAEADAAEEGVSSDQTRKSIVDTTAESPEVKRRGRAPKPVFEKVGSGRGGFSVKGAAAAAARARWDKVRREKAERGEESDDDKPKRRATGGGASNSTRNKKPSDDTPASASLPSPLPDSNYVGMRSS
jgi:chromatin structure-remodeling complex protein RSC7